jgi:hypothetical protein
VRVDIASANPAATFNGDYDAQLVWTLVQGAPIG